MTEPVCMWHDDGWPMSADEPGCHKIEAEGQYVTVPCRRPDEYAKFAERKRQEQARAMLWQLTCKEEKGYDARNRRYIELLREHGLAGGEV